MELGTFCTVFTVNCVAFVLGYYYTQYIYTYILIILAFGCRVDSKLDVHDSSTTRR